MLAAMPLEFLGRERERGEALQADEAVERTPPALPHDAAHVAHARVVRISPDELLVSALDQQT